MSAQIMSPKIDTSHWASYLGLKPFLSIMLVVDKKEGTTFGPDKILQKKRSIPTIYSVTRVRQRLLH